MRIVLLCATARGLRFLDRLIKLATGCELVVCSFREEPWEPPFFESIGQRAREAGAQFLEAKQVGAARLAPLWEAAPIDLLLAVSWRFLVPPEVYRRARRGAFVFHDSLLPKYRGFAPTVWAMINGESQTGVTLFEMTESVDAGDIIHQRAVPIGADETIKEVMDRVTQTYLEILEATFLQLVQGTLPRQPQDHTLATYTCSRVPDDNRIDWVAPTASIYNLIRATSEPYPGAFTYLEGKVLRVWGARRLPETLPYVGRVPGRVIQRCADGSSLVLTGDGVLALTRVQHEGEPIVPAAQVLSRPSQTLGR